MLYSGTCDGGGTRGDGDKGTEVTGLGVMKSKERGDGTRGDEVKVREVTGPGVMKSKGERLRDPG